MTTTKQNKRLQQRHVERQEEKRQQVRRQRLIMLAAGVGVLLFAIVIGVATSQGGGERVRVDDLAGSPVIAGTLDTAPPPGEADPAVGTSAPVVDGAGFDGTPVAFGDPGQAQLVMFVASWCEACRAELPEVVDWLDRGALPEDVAFTTVVTWLDEARPNWPPDAWLAEENYTGRVLVDDADGSVAAAYGQPATPYWVAIDADGNIVSRVSGMMSQEQMSQLAASISATD